MIAFSRMNFSGHGNNGNKKIKSTKQTEHTTWYLKLVPGEGLEPSRPCGQRILSPLRLPIPPSRHQN